MKYNPATRAYTLSSGDAVSEINVALFRGGKFSRGKDALRVMEAELLGWSCIDYDPAGKPIGLPPNAQSPADFETIPEDAPLEIIIRALDPLTDEQRRDLFSQLPYCPECGRKTDGEKCQCWNDA